MVSCDSCSDLLVRVRIKNEASLRCETEDHRDDHADGQDGSSSPGDAHGSEDQHVNENDHVGRHERAAIARGNGERPKRRKV